MREKRVCVWIDGFQSKLFFRILCYSLIYQVTLWNFLFVWRLLEEGPGNPIEQARGFFLSNYPMLICCLVIVPFFAWDAVRFSHRLVGPIYRFRKTIQSVTAGEKVRPIKLRDGDYLTEMRDDLNAMMGSLQARGALILDVAGAGSNGQPQAVNGVRGEVVEKV
jgi:hypothetical protein